MPSPFPGMNPYLEHDYIFHGFHQHFVVDLQYALVPQVRPKYIVDLDSGLYFQEANDDEVTRKPDSGQFPELLAGAVRSSFCPISDVIEVYYVKIMDRESRQVVTVIEVLSRTNKLSAADRTAYLAKRNQIRRSDVHFIEIDLLRAGEPMPLTTQPDANYRVMLSRCEQRPTVALWPIRLRDPLPTIPVPLRAPDADVSLDLQAVLNRVYDTAAYSDYVYSQTPQPPLHPEDARWAEELIASTG